MLSIRAILQQKKNKFEQPKAPVVEKAKEDEQGKAAPNVIVAVRHL